MICVNAENFYKELVFVINKEENKREGVRAYQNNSAFTTFITLIIKKVLESDCKEIETSLEYYRIDITSWIQRRNEINSQAPHKFHSYLWDLQAAVEHENDSNDWMDEVIKLAHINCPLRVVIGYLPVGEDHQEYIDYVSNAINMLQCPQDSANEFLLLIGNSKTKVENDYFNYRPYLFKNNNFQLQSDWIIVV
ncbi:hypothetical protein AGMMS50284_1080 [Clostridia bacterium]|nr:hypothetical protein AGMMS50284_1080 [Clostridia bacterium]